MPEEAVAGIAFVEGAYVPTREARIPILDNLVSNSDCTFDVVAVWDGAFFRLDDHLDRLERSCERLQLHPAPTRQEVREMLFETVKRSGLRRAYAQVIVSRGVPRLGKERDPRLLTPELYGFAIPYQWILPEDQQEAGLDLVVAQTVTRIPASAVDPTVKNFQRGDFTRGQLEARDRGAQFCLLSDGKGLLTEGEGMNIFALVDGTLYTPANDCLFGITRKVALEIADEAGIPTVVGELPVALSEKAEEMFGTSTAGGVMAFATLDGKPVGSGKEGPVTRQIRERYWELHYDPRYTDPVDYPSE